MTKPSNLDEAIQSLLKLMPPGSEDFEAIKKFEHRDLIKLHFSLGRYIRNEYGLWDKTSNLENNLKDVVQSDHPDDISMYIIEKFWEHIRTLP